MNVIFTSDKKYVSVSKYFFPCTLLVSFSVVRLKDSNNTRCEGTVRRKIGFDNKGKETSSEP